MEEQTPWWNDKDKVGGICATIMLLGIACFLSLMLIFAAIKIGTGLF